MPDMNRSRVTFLDQVDGKWERDTGRAAAPERDSIKGQSDL